MSPAGLSAPQGEMTGWTLEPNAVRTRMKKLRAPQAISFGAANLAHEWRKWRKQFEIYFQAAELSKKAEATQVAILLNMTGTEGQEIYDAFVFTAGDEGPAVGDVLNKFDDYCNPCKNEVFERHQFWNRDQHEDETVDQWLTDLRTSLGRLQ